MRLEIDFSIGCRRRRAQGRTSSTCTSTATSRTRRSSTRASTRGRPPSRTPRAPAGPAARPTAAARAHRTAASSPVSAWCSPTSKGPGVVRHIWLTVPPARPERMRALTLEVRYEGRDEPSISTPVLDFFGLPHGRPVAYHSIAHDRAGGPRVQLLPPDAVPRAHRDRLHQPQRERDHALLPGRLHAAAGGARRARLPARGLPAREPHGAEARLRDHRGPARAPAASSAARWACA